MSPGHFHDDIQVGDERLTPRIPVTQGHALADAGLTADCCPAEQGA